jgi:cysteine synthase B
MNEPAPGPTPLVRLGKLSPSPRIRLYAKLDWYLPTGSLKDRIAAEMLGRAEQEGRLQPGTRLLEPTSGNTGIALARLARLRGYTLTVVVPANVSRERKDLLRLFGADIIETPGEEGSNGAIVRAKELVAEGGYTMLFQYGNPANPDAHYRTTGPEILAQVEHVDVFVGCLGTGGTLMGVGRALREANPDVQIVAAEPPAGEQIAGLRSLDDGYIPPIFDPNAIDGKILVRTRAAVVMTRRLLEEEGLFAGISSGAAVHAARRWAERLEEGTIVTLLPDGGWKYLSTGAWTGSVDEAIERLADQLYF